MTKKIILVAVAVMSLAFSRLSAQVEEGNVIIEGYYGFPNMWTSIFKALATDEGGAYGVTASGFGPAGLRAEYLVSDRFGVGVDFFYANSKLEYSENTFDDMGNAVTYNYSIALPRPRFLLRGNVHLGNSDVVDPYLAFGLGYNASKFKFETNDPFFDEDAYLTRPLIPIAYRTAFGTRFIFGNHFGAGVEVGIGGPLLTVGLSGKF